MAAARTRPDGHRDKIPSLVSLAHVTIERAGRTVFHDLSLNLNAGDRVYLEGDNGAGKSSLLMLLAGRLHPHGDTGERRYAWDGLTGADFRASQKYLALISREEQLRLSRIHAASSVSDFLLGHCDGADFLYRDVLTSDRQRIAEILRVWQIENLAHRTLKTLSFGELRICLIARASLFSRKLYLFDEVLSGLSARVVERVMRWIDGLPTDCALVMTGHDANQMALVEFNENWQIEGGRLRRSRMSRDQHGRIQCMPDAAVTTPVTYSPPQMRAEVLVRAVEADFYHDFTRIFENLSFCIASGERILLTGENGSGKSTLLRIIHGDFYPAWGKGRIEFLGALEHRHKRELWAKVQLVAAAHFSYYPEAMSVAAVIGSRFSGSIYAYPQTLPESAAGVVEDFALRDFLTRPFSRLSEGEKTRVLLARAFVLPAPVYLIDEGFIALSEGFFSSALGYLAHLPAQATVVVAANERLETLRTALGGRALHWQLQDGRLFETVDGPIRLAAPMVDTN